MKSILMKCSTEDLSYLSSVLDSYLSFVSDKGRKKLLLNANKAQAKGDLIDLMDSQIKYFGSSDVAFLKRRFFGGGGVSSKEIVEDVCRKLGVSIKQGGSVEARLERLVNAVVEKELINKSPGELSAAFKDMGIGDEKIKLALEHVKSNGKVAVLPVLVQILGPKVTLGIIEVIIVSLIAQVVGREAAKLIVKELLKRNPWINALGPVLWVLSGAWLAFDLQGPAYRKTIPICLYLGVVALRDGEEQIALQ